jgi:multidrug resistance efflux pump
MSESPAEAPASAPEAAAPAEVERAPQAANPLRRTALVVLGIALVLFVLSVLMERRTPSTSQAVVQAYVVPMAPEVGGRVTEVGVLDNAIVAPGEVLFRVDPQPYAIAVAEAEAQLERIGQSIGASTAMVDVAQARVVEARANRDNVREQTQRAFELVERGVYARAKADEAKAALDSEEAAVDAAEADLVRAREELGPAGEDNPQLKEALAALERARLDLVRTTVSAPSEGVISNLQLAVGQVIGVGQPSLTFIDAGTIWIAAAFKENSLEHVRAGNRAELVLDSLPGRVFDARVESVGWGVSQQRTDPATGLPAIRDDSGWVREPQRFSVRLVFAGDRPTGIRYGSQANVVIYTGENPVMNVIGGFWIRLIAALTYVT